MQTLTLSSPAKINLYLRVLGKRKDGYHSLYTLFHRISLADKIKLTRRPHGFSLKCRHPSVPTGSRNLITRAYRVLQKRFPGLGGVEVVLEKKIPVKAGLGGGSSNAAFFLLGMKKLYHLRLPQREWIRMGAQLGADVPFFLLDTPQALGRGIGEKLAKRPCGKRLWFLLLITRKGLSTKEVFRHLPRTGRPPSLTKLSRAVTMLSAYLAKGRITRAADYLCNDLESAAFSLRPSIGKKICKLHKLGAKAARLSGSGPTVFAILSHKRQARSLARQLSEVWPVDKWIVCCSK